MVLKMPSEPLYPVGGVKALPGSRMLWGQVRRKQHYAATLKSFNALPQQLLRMKDSCCRMCLFPKLL